ncbi:hypothetical protein MFAL_05820 [Mycolicibacterium fallax]|nr:hypothetical protein MFAL_05820 [Mycolicibacterium fallax]
MTGVVVVTVVTVVTPGKLGMLGISGMPGRRDAGTPGRRDAATPGRRDAGTPGCRGAEAPGKPGYRGPAGRSGIPVRRPHVAPVLAQPAGIGSRDTRDTPQRVAPRAARASEFAEFSRAPTIDAGRMSPRAASGPTNPLLTCRFVERVEAGRPRIGPGLRPRRSARVGAAHRSCTRVLDKLKWGWG